MPKGFVIDRTSIRKPLSTSEIIRKYGLTKADVAAVEAFLRREREADSSREARSKRSRTPSRPVVGFKRHSRARSSSRRK